VPGFLRETEKVGDEALVVFEARRALLFVPPDGELEQHAARFEPNRLESSKGSSTPQRCSTTQIRKERGPVIPQAAACNTTSVIKY